MALSIAVLSLCYFMIEPFLGSLTSAVALAVVMVPMQRALEARRWPAGLAALATVATTVVLIALPFAMVGQRLVGETITAAVTVEAFFRTGAWQDFLNTNPWLDRAARWIAEQTDLPAIATSLSTWATGAVTSIVRASGTQVVAAIIALYMLFFALRDRKLALAFISRVSPLSALEMTALNQDIAQTIRATLLGTVLVALIQGALGGAMFAFLGLPSPLLWGLVMGLAAIVPVLGTFLVWLPAAIFLFLTGSEWQALILVLWGVIVIASIDNLLYPVLVGNRLRTHTIPTFIALVGGLFVFGPAGLILGPVIFTIALFLLDYWRGEPLSPPLQAHAP